MPVLPCDDDLARGWVRLESKASLPSQTLAFHAALAGTMMPGLVRDIVTVGKGQAVTAVLPLCRRRGWLARWHAAGARQLYEPLDALCHDEDATRMLADKLTGFSRSLRLDRVPAGSPLVAALAKGMKGRGILITRPDKACPIIVFGPGETDPEMRFNAGRRSDFRRARRRAEQLGTVSFEMHAPTPDTFDALFDQAVAVEQHSWKGDEGTALGSDQVKAAFFRDFLSRASEHGNCRIAFMRIDGRAVAMQLALQFQRRYWLFKIGFDRDFARCSPGNLLMLHAMKDAMERGLKGIELLGEVEPWIIEVWTQDTHDCVRIQTYPFNPRGMATLLVEALLWTWHRLPLRLSPRRKPA